MAANLKRTLVLVAGWSLMALGVAGLLLPVLPGMLLLLAGISILSSEYVWAHRLVQRVRKRFPKFGRRLRTADAWARNRFASLFAQASRHSKI